MINSLLPGIQVLSLQNTLLSNNTVIAPTAQGIVIFANSQGGATFSNNTVTDLRAGGVSFEDDSRSFSATGSGNSGFTPQ